MPPEKFGQDRLLEPERELTTVATPQGVDRRSFMMRTAVVGAAAVMAGSSVPTLEGAQAPKVAGAPPLGGDLDVKKAKLPFITIDR
jgi:hypothetical protein